MSEDEEGSAGEEDGAWVLPATPFAAAAQDAAAAAEYAALAAHAPAGVWLRPHPRRRLAWCGVARVGGGPHAAALVALRVALPRRFPNTALPVRARPARAVLLIFILFHFISFLINYN